MIRAFLVLFVAGIVTVSCGEEKTEPVEEVIPKGDAGRRMFFELRCESGHAGMCGELAMMYEKGWGGDRDKKKADQYYKRSCEEGVLESCEKAGIEMTTEHQKEILDSRCEKGVAFACNNLGHLLWLGKGVEHDPTRARTMLKKGCEGGFSASCRGLGKMWGTGQGGPKDKEKALEWKKKGEVAFAAEEAMKLKYLHTTPMTQRPVGKARPELLEARKKQAKEVKDMNKQMIENRLNQKKSEAADGDIPPPAR